MNMLKRFSFTGFLFFVLACNAPFLLTTTPTPASNPPGPRDTDTPTPASKPGWDLVFQDEFNAPSLSPAWTTEYWWGRLNPPELQFYAPDAFDFENGVLRIKAERRSMAGRSYTSGLISTLSSFNFQYGYAEIRSRAPAGKGLWPAFWLLTVERPETGEIDVLEILGNQPNVVYMSWHFTDSNGTSKTDTRPFAGPDFSAGFHTFAVDWQKDVIVWYVDGVERYRLTEDIPQAPMYVIANLAVGGKWPGSPNARTPFPSYFDIDYIRVYQQSN